MSEAIRLNKFLSEAGVLSRRKADEAIDKGEICINGHVALMGDKVTEEDTVTYKGEVVSSRKKVVIYAYNKPLGLVCTAENADKDSLFKKTKFPVSVNYVGRLDKDSQGLLLLTNDGDLANQIQKARNNHEKEYIVRVDHEITGDFLKKMQNGVPILDTVTKKCVLKKQGTHSFKIIITQGLNRQIRRMCEHFGYRVVYLKRIRVMNVELGDLQPGEYRELTKEEERILRRSCEGDR